MTRRQISEAQKAGFAGESLTIREKLTDYLWTDEGKSDYSELLRRIMENDRFVVDTSDASDGEKALEWGRKHGMDAREVGNRIADTLAGLVMDVVDLGLDRMLLLTGGDVLYHTMQVMGVTELEPLAEVSPGVILSLFHYGSIQRPILTKSGGFGKDDLLIRLGERIVR